MLYCSNSISGTGVLQKTYYLTIEQPKLDVKPKESLATAPVARPKHQFDDEMSDESKRRRTKDGSNTEATRAHDVLDVLGWSASRRPFILALPSGRKKRNKEAIGLIGDSNPPAAASESISDAAKK